jgi:hypothetical protein
MELAIYGVGCLFSSTIRKPECVQPGCGVHDYLRVPALTALPRRPSPGKDGQGDMI